MKEIIVASTNQGKIKEIKAMLKDIDIEVLSMKDVLEQELEIEETGTTPISQTLTEIPSSFG